jgi:hypothetical protein
MALHNSRTQDIPSPSQTYLSDAMCFIRWRGLLVFHLLASNFKIFLATLTNILFNLNMFPSMT